MAEPSTTSIVLDAARLAYALSKEQSSTVLHTSDGWWAIRGAAYEEFDAAITMAGKAAVAQAFKDAASNTEARNQGSGISIDWLRSEARKITEETSQ